jgi:hypothetical protein
MHRIFPRKLAGITLAACCLLPGFLLHCDKSPDEADKTLFNLRLTEVHYNPLDTTGMTGDSLEFIELKNTGSLSLDIGSLEFTDGIDYAFPTDATLEGGGFYVIASNQNGFKLRYGFYPDGVYSGQLSNSGETIELTDALTNTVIFSQTYSDTNGWPTEPDGKGYSLVPIATDPGLNATDPASWRKSAMVNGSPGKDDILLPIDSTLLDLRITEIQYHPADPDTFGGDSLEFIELKNIGSNVIGLGRVAFTSGISYAFRADAKLNPGSFLVLASNKTEFQRRYDKPPFDVYTGQLSNSSDKIVIEDIQAAQAILTVEYLDCAPWPTAADGDGCSLVPYSKNPDRNQNAAAAWRTSFRKHGSPGADDPEIVVVNEVLPFTAEKDAIELYNPGDASVDIGGWFLTDRRADPIKFIIPKGTVIAAGDYVQFTEDDFTRGENAANPFALSSHGDDVYIMADSGGYTGGGYYHGFHFGELEQEVSFGRYITVSGKEAFTAQSAVTLGKENSGPRVGPLVISEIMYKSSDGKGDFIEITNIGIQEIRLYDPHNPQNTWKVEGITFAFPENNSIGSGESIIIASDSLSIDAFKARYSLSAVVKVFLMQGSVPDSEQKLSLLKPEDPYIDDSLVSTVPTVPYMVIDEVEYSEQSPWPTDANSGSQSLQRTSKTVFGNDFASWKAALPTPGKCD